jgi:hypothetical protein
LQSGDIHLKAIEYIEKTLAVSHPGPQTAGNIYRGSVMFADLIQPPHGEKCDE